MIRDQLIQHIVVSPRPVTTTTTASAAGLNPSAESLAAVDLLLALSPEVKPFADGWIASANTRDGRVLRALRGYAEAHPEKRIFRGTAALGHLPAEDQMTEQQLRELFSRIGEFQLLANGMIKRAP